MRLVMMATAQIWLNAQAEARALAAAEMGGAVTHAEIRTRTVEGLEMRNHR
jgi:hypothetical protein